MTDEAVEAAASIRTWNYRTIRDVDTVGEEAHEWYTIREVYYDEAGRIVSWTDDPCYPTGDTLTECLEDYARMGQAADMPVIDVSSGEPVEMP